MSNIPQVLTIAGSDSGGGAGIQADLKTFQMQGVFGTSVVTAVTAQNTQGVFDIHTIPLKTIRSQLQAVKNDFNIASVKIGMLGTPEIIECVAESLQERPFGNLVLDPVMIAKGGAPLLQPQAVSALIEHLLPLADVITPNLPETEALTGMTICDEMSIQKAAKSLQKLGARNVIIKGGHSLNSQSEQCQDWVLLADGGYFVLESPRFYTPHTHGTGCTFSACLTAELAKGKPLQSAVKIAKDFITAAISHPLNIGHGHGPTNHWAYRDLVNLKRND
ncbi:bifunctional hydroxymethylpyrimidine kinase/phosphomethylpyrimidine kinase [Rodentibacter caecimuris]|uniref:bifunctional hydroxymethylpyrimidine kinase/phosphomethylpyrimidine kinase n=1 Tax=Rodentibacter caecimuris TaxID=1796644 RepID=UPI000984DD29|nr:bifunctional hydroxymethylpyrimidine kinase/phosphomethylpyrimidine kinase [Rodentibacter heylii]